MWKKIRAWFKARRLMNAVKQVEEDMLVHEIRSMVQNGMTLKDATKFVVGHAVDHGGK